MSPGHYSNMTHIRISHHPICFLLPLGASASLANTTVSFGPRCFYEILSIWRWDKDEPPLEEQSQACSASPSGMWCLCSQLQFFFPLQIFYPFKANSLSTGWGVLSKEASKKAEWAHQALSPLFQTVWSEWTDLGTTGSWEVWNNTCKERISVCPSGRLLGEMRIPTPCDHNLTAATDC